MHFKSLAYLGLMFVVVGVVVQADYKRGITTTAKDCMTELKTDEATIRSFMTEEGIAKDNEIMESFFGCCMRTHITDTNELIGDDKFTSYITDVFTNRLEGRRNLAVLLAKKCIEHCKDTKGDTKGKTAVKTLNCLMTQLNDYIKKAN